VPSTEAVVATTKTGTAPVARPAGGETIRHIVKPGESLSVIAQQYGVRQGDIAVANNISDPQKIRANMELIIPGWQATTKAGNVAPKGSSKAAAKSAEPVFNVETSPVTSPQPSGVPVPVIQIDDSPLAPAPKAP
jgi:LysM repeat protein